MYCTVAAISGSPRKGNTEALLESALEGCRKAGAKTKLVRLRNLKISHCCGWDGCYREHRCIVRDDAQKLYAKLKRADAWLLGTPDYFNNVSGLMKDFIDRSNPYCEQHEFQGKKAGLVVAGGGKIKSVAKCEKTLREFCRIHKMVVVGSVRAAHVDKPGEVLSSKKAMKEAFGLGKKLVAGKQ